VPGSRKRTDVALRRDQVLTLDLAGYRDQQIADKLGLKLSTVQSDLHIVRKDLAARIDEKAEERRAREFARLEDAITEVTRILHERHVVTSGGSVVRRNEFDPESEPLRDNGPNLQAAAMLAKLSAEIRKLYGLDAATKVEQQVGGTVEYVVKVSTEEMDQV
jgi:hypothetical protein